MYESGWLPTSLQICSIMNNFDLRWKMLSHFYFELPLFMSKVENLYIYGPLVIFLWITCPSSLPFFYWVVFFMLICERFRKLTQLYSKIIKLSIFSYSTFIALFQASLVTQRVRNPSVIGRPGLIPGLGRSPREGNGNSPQYSCLENSLHGQRRLASRLWAEETVTHVVTKSRIWLSDQHTHSFVSVRDDLNEGTLKDARRRPIQKLRGRLKLTKRDPSPLRGCYPDRV